MLKELNQLWIFIQSPNDPKPNYQFELTTTAFRVNEDRVLVVAEEHLDRDPPHPSNLQFQVNK